MYVIMVVIPRFDRFAVVCDCMRYSIAVGGALRFDTSPPTSSVQLPPTLQPSNPPTLLQPSSLPTLQPALQQGQLSRLEEGLEGGLEGWRKDGWLEGGRGGWRVAGLEDAGDAGLEGWRLRVALEVRYCDAVSCCVDFCDVVFCGGDTIR